MRSWALGGESSKGGVHRARPLCPHSRSPLLMLAMRRRGQCELMVSNKQVQHTSSAFPVDARGSQAGLTREEELRLTSHLRSARR